MQGILTRNVTRYHDLSNFRFALYFFDIIQPSFRNDGQDDIIAESDGGSGLPYQPSVQRGGYSQIHVSHPSIRAWAELQLTSKSSQPGLCVRTLPKEARHYLRYTGTTRQPQTQYSRADRISRHFLHTMPRSSQDLLAGRTRRF